MFSFLKKFLIKLIAPVVVTAVATTTTAISPQSTASDFTAKSFEKSITAEAFCNLSAEASQYFLGDLYTEYMDIENNNIDGWIHVHEETFLNDGFTYSLWVNKYNSSTYTIVYSGTDDLADVLQYLPMMIHKQNASQIAKAIEVTKNIQKTIAEKGDPKFCGNLDKLYITGHSLGGYLAMYVASEMADSYLHNTHYDISIQDVGLDNIYDIKCVTFGAPGMYYEPLTINVGNFQTSNIFPLQPWHLRKIENNKQNYYDTIIYQYINNQDIVANLLKEDKNTKLTQTEKLIGFGVELEHIGTLYTYKTDQITVAQKVEFERKASNIVGKVSGTLIATILNGTRLTNAVYGHMPWVYINLNLDDVISM